MATGHVKTCFGEGRRTESDRRISLQPFRHPSALLLAAVLAIGAVGNAGTPAHAQTQWQPQSPQYIQCPTPGQPLIRIPEIVSDHGKLRGTIVLNNGAQRMYLGAADTTQCLPQEVRQFVAPHGVLPAYQGAIPPGYPERRAA